MEQLTCKHGVGGSVMLDLWLVVWLVELSLLWWSMIVQSLSQQEQERSDLPIGLRRSSQDRNPMTVSW